MDMEKWIAIAKDCGFDQAAALDVATLRPMQMVRDACAADKCRLYGRTWTCPPHCGTLEQCTQQMSAYTNGILVQTVGQLRRDIDSKGYQEAAQRHAEQFMQLVKQVRAVYPDALCLGSGGCIACKSCAYPEPCRFPELAVSSMEAYGLFVTQVCRDNGISYYYGKRTIAYSACILF